MKYLLSILLSLWSSFFNPPTNSLKDTRDEEQKVVFTVYADGGITVDGYELKLLPDQELSKPIEVGDYFYVHYEKEEMGIEDGSYRILANLMSVDGTSNYVFTTTPLNDDKMIVASIEDESYRTWIYKVPNIGGIMGGKYVDTPSYFKWGYKCRMTLLNGNVYDVNFECPNNYTDESLAKQDMENFSLKDCYYMHVREESMYWGNPLTLGVFSDLYTQEMEILLANIRIIGHVATKRGSTVDPFRRFQTMNHSHANSPRICFYNLFTLSTFVPADENAPFEDGNRFGTSYEFIRAYDKGDKRIFLFKRFPENKLIEYRRT